MKSKFELGKTYNRRDGGAVELVHTYDYEGDEWLVWMKEPSGGGQPYTYQTLANGCILTNGEFSCDVLPPKLTGTVWVNVYDSEYTSTGFAYKTREAADRYASYRPSRQACLEVPWEEGQGLEDEN